MLGTFGIVAVGIYLLSLLVIGALARRASRAANLKDFYLAGGTLGVASLFFTLYATQYSGNTLFGVPGQAYAQGFEAMSVVLAVMGIVAAYTLFAPALNRIAHREGFVTPGDFLRWRYADRRLLVAVNVIFVFTLTGYVLANLKAVGLLVETATGGLVPFATGVLVLSAIMAVYESWGGMRSVVWTDVLQGSILLAGCVLVFIVVWQSDELGLLPAADFAADARRTLGDAEGAAGFVSLLLLVAFGAAVYPQAIQRIYAARSAQTLQRSYAILVVMPLLVMLPLTVVAMSARDWLPPLGPGESERVILHTIEYALADSGVWVGIVALFIGAAIAAIMSTVDSALLALGSIISNDILGGPGSGRSDAELHRIGRTTTWVLMAVMAVLAIVLPQSIWALMVLKFELLAQAAPAVIVGTRYPAVRAPAVLAGLMAGGALVIALKVLPVDSDLLGIHAGFWGLAANLAVLAAVNSRGRAIAPVERDNV